MGIVQFPESLRKPGNVTDDASQIIVVSTIEGELAWRWVNLDSIILRDLGGLL